MPNMSYCRFENTLRDLRDCINHISDTLEGSEKRARANLIDCCQDIINEYEEKED